MIAAFPPPPILHAGLIATRIGGHWRGALIEGPSGAGKSDLALRAIERGWRLVADDRVLLFLSGGRLFGRAPPALAGRLEARGLAILACPCLPFAGVDLVVRCAGPDEAIERLPDDERTTLLGVPLPRLAVHASHASAPALAAAAMRRLGGRRQPE